MSNAMPVDDLVKQLDKRTVQGDLSGRLRIPDPLCQKAKARIEAQAKLIARLREGLAELFASYKQLADSGDAGNWRLEDEPEGAKAVALLAELDAKPAPKLDQQKLGWHIPENLRWLAENPGAGYLPCGSLHGKFLYDVADRFESMATKD